MPNQEDKRNFVQGGIDRDLNARILPPGKMRDALNVNTGRSEGADVGSLENLRGNDLISGQGSIQGTTIGQIADPLTDRVYMFVAHPTQGDGIYEYDPSTGNISTIVVDDNDPGTGVGTGQGTVGFTYAGDIPAAGLSAGSDLSSSITRTGDAVLTSATLNAAVLENTLEDRSVTITIDIAYNIPASFDNGGPGTIQITATPNQLGAVLTEGTFTFMFTGTIPSAGLVDRSDVASFITPTGNATLTRARLDGAVIANTNTTTRTVSVRVEIDYNVPPGFTNSGAGSFVLTATPTQAAGIATDNFTFANAGVTCSVNVNGTVIQNSLIGTSSLGVGQTSSYGTVSASTSRTISVRVVGTVPSGFINSGQPFDFTGDCPAIQPPFSIPTFTFANAGVGCTVDSQSGNITLSASPGYTPVIASGPSSYPVVTSDTARNISVRVTGTIPGGFQSAGDPFTLTGTCSTTQRARTLGAFTQSDWTGSVSVSPLGQVLINNGNVGAAITNPASFSSNTGNDPVNRTLSVTLQNIPSGFSNTGGNITFSTTVAQPSNLPIFTEADWNGVVSVSQAGGVTSTVGNAGPITIITRTVPPNNTANDITVNIMVEVTIPSGFRFFGSRTTVSRGATQAGVGVTTFNTVVTVDGSGLTNASVSPSTLTLTAQAGQQDSSSFSVIPGAGSSFTNRNQVSVTSSNNTLASGIQNLDSFGNIVVTVSGTVGSSDQAATLTVTGGPAGAIGNVSIAGSTTASVGATASTCTANISGTATGLTYQWTVSSGLTIQGSDSGQTIFIIATSQGSQTVSVTVSSSGMNETASKTIFVTGGGGPI